jgi:hypothetical protein
MHQLFSTINTKAYDWHTVTANNNSDVMTCKAPNILALPKNENSFHDDKCKWG